MVEHIGKKQEVESTKISESTQNGYNEQSSENGAKTMNGDTVINIVILVVVGLLFIGVLSTYFVKNLPRFMIGARELTLQVVWVIIGGYAIGELLKIVFLNRARLSPQYQTAKSKAEKELTKIANQKNNKVKEYCEQYTEEIFRNNRIALLSASKISLEVFEERYQALSTKEILEKYPNDNLSKKQLSSIRKANAVKKKQYNPNFLISTLHGSVKEVPSERYNAEKRNIKNSVSSMIFSVLSGIFGVSLASGIIFDFSSEIVLAAIIKVLLLLFTISLRLVFVHSLVFKTEMGRFCLQTIEAKQYMLWYEENYSVERNWEDDDV